MPNDMPSQDDVFVPTKQKTQVFVVEDVIAFAKNSTNYHNGTTSSDSVATRRKPSPKDHDDPPSRVSMYKKIYPSSVESEWTWIDSLGWCHMREMHAFKREYFKCECSGAWCRMDDMVIFESSDGSKKIGRSYATQNNLVLLYNGHYAEQELCIQINHFSMGTASMVYFNKDYLGGSVIQCDYDDEQWTTESMIKVYCNPKYKRVSRMYVDGESFAACNKCERIFYIDDTEFDEDDGATMCVPCFTEASAKKIIFAHNYNKYPAIQATPVARFPIKTGHDGSISSGPERIAKETPVRLFGVEVETEMYALGMMKKNLLRYQVAKSLLEAVGPSFAIIKEDGSLITNGKYSDGSNGAKYAGFEIVSAPATLDIHKNIWPRLQNSEHYQLLRAWDTKTCGFHVHVSREGMSALQIARIVLFVNHKNNKMFIQKVAGRGSDKYCRYFDKEPKDAIGVHHKNDDNRRQAVNLTNPHTIEFRMFRGTVNPKHIIRNMEFCDAICDFCYPASRSLADIETTQPFLDFVFARSKRWPLLAAWLNLHEFIKLRLPKNKDFWPSISVNVLDIPESELPVLANQPGNESTF